MVTGLGTSAAAMQAQGERLAVLANNLANVTAGGFKADRVEFFQSLSSPRAAGPGVPGSAAPPPPPRIRTATDLSAGSLRDTGNALDLALEGPGFFVLRAAGGLRLTRAGAFTRGADGSLAAADGTPVLDQRQEPVRLPERGRIAVDEGGRIAADGATVGTLLVVDPPAARRLPKEGGTRFVVPPDMALEPAKDTRVRQGALEQSNVNPVLTLVEMIDALRLYEAAQRAARSLDETLGRAVNDVGRP
jgi:flagellar basal-body rod protein FlgG